VTTTNIGPCVWSVEKPKSARPVPQIATRMAHAIARAVVSLRIVSSSVRSGFSGSTPCTARSARRWASSGGGYNATNLSRGARKGRGVRGGDERAHEVEVFDARRTLDTARDIDAIRRNDAHGLGDVVRPEPAGERELALSRELRDER